MAPRVILGLILRTPKVDLLFGSTQESGKKLPYHHIGAFSLPKRSLPKLVETTTWIIS